MLALFLFFVWVVTACAASPAAPLAQVVRDGDIVLHRSQSSQSEAIQAATGSPWTHVGLVFQRDGEWTVLEAVQPVKYTPLDAWVRRGRDQQVVAVRSREAVDADRLRRVAEGYLGRPYDTLFEWSDERIYCSELVTKAYAEQDLQVGTLVPFTALDLSSPVVQALVQARKPAGVDPQQQLVPPGSYLDDPGLQVVFGAELVGAASPR